MARLLVVCVFVVYLTIFNIFLVSCGRPSRLSKKKTGRLNREKAVKNEYFGAEFADNLIENDIMSKEILQEFKDIKNELTAIKERGLGMIPALTVQTLAMETQQTQIPSLSGCGATPLVNNGVFGLINATYSVNETAELVCNSGYTRNTAFVAEATITCQENGEWDTCTAYCVESCSSIGTSYMVGLFKLREDEDVPYLYISVYEPTNITISSFQNDSLLEESVDNYYIFNVSDNLLSDNNTKSKVGIEVKASSPINLYIHYGDYSRYEGMGVFPEKCANKEYIIASHINYYSYQGKSSIVALEDNTTIQIKEQPSEMTITQTLNRFDVYSIAGDELSGTFLSADKNIQVFAGQTFARIPKNDIGSSNHLLEQMPPLASLRRAYLLTFQAPRPHYSVRVVAPYDSTDVTFADVNGTKIKTVQLNASQNHFASFYNSTTISVTSTKDILVVQYGHGKHSESSAFGNPSYVVMCSFTQFINNYMIMVDREVYAQNYVAIFIRVEDDMSGLRVGNTSLESDSFITALVPGVGKYRIVHKKIDSFASDPTPIKITHTKSFVKFGLVQYGFGKSAGYAFMAGRNVPDYTAVH